MHSAPFPIAEVMRFSAQLALCVAQEGGSLANDAPPKLDVLEALIKVYRKHGAAAFDMRNPADALGIALVELQLSEDEMFEEKGAE